MKSIFWFDCAGWVYSSETNYTVIFPSKFSIVAYRVSLRRLIREKTAGVNTTPTAPVCLETQHQTR